MPKERVENFRLSKDQVKFMKQYKEVNKMHKLLSTEFKRTLSEADELRQALTSVESNMDALVETSKGFSFDKLEGQEDIRDEPREQIGPNTPEKQMPVNTMPEPEIGYE